MTLADDVDLEEFVMSKDELSGADIKAVCTEVGRIVYFPCAILFSFAFPILVFIRPVSSPFAHLLACLGRRLVGLNDEPSLYSWRYSYEAVFGFSINRCFFYFRLDCWR